MPYAAVLVVILAFMSVMQSNPQLWWWFFGAIALLFLWLYLDSKWERYQLRRTYERELTQRIHDEQVRMALAEQALKNAYTQSQVRISNMKRKRL